MSRDRPSAVVADKTTSNVEAQNEDRAKTYLGLTKRQIGYIALGVTCLLLAGGMAYVFTTYGDKSGGSEESGTE